MNTTTDSLRWATEHFSGVRLYNKTKVKRLISMAFRMAEGKMTSLARLFDNWYDTKATYTLLKNQYMTPDIIQETHRQLVYAEMENWQHDVLAIEDSSEFEWNGKAPIQGLGPIGSGREKDQGFILHTTLAVGTFEENDSVKVFGTVFQQFYVRPPVRKKKKKRSDTTETIETDLWRTVISEKAIPPKKNVIRICDRNADIYEVMQETKEYGCRHVIRLKHDRIVLSENIAIKELMNIKESQGDFEITKRFKGEQKEQTLKLSVNWEKVDLRAPSRPGIGIGKLTPLQETIVHVWGYDDKGELIEWFLYTDLEVNSIEDAIKIAKYYAKRWIIEDFHKMLKTGLKAEDLQLEQAHSIFATIAIMSVVASRLVGLRENLRINPDAPASESGLSELEIKVLGKYLKREIKTVKCVVLAIGRLGGHQNRKGDGMPGVLSLWRGLSRFLSIMEGVLMMVNKNY